jgi:hypothetical protein
VFGFEVEYAGSVGEGTLTSPAITTITGAFVVQSTPRDDRLQVCGVGGFGLYGETMADGRGSGEIAATSVGGGVKIPVSGALKLRLDYRVFLLGEAADAAPGFVVSHHPQRVSAGFSLAF